MLPPKLRQADADLASIQRRISVSQHLNPENEVEAQARFLRGEPARFTYRPLPAADELLRALDRVAPPADHLLGTEVSRARDQFRLWVEALRDRTTAAFEALAAHSGWLDEVDPPPPDAFPVRQPDPGVLPIHEVVSTFRAALAARNCQGWTVHLDPVMTARVLVDSARREVHVNPRAVVSSTDLRALVAHEIDIHVGRSERGARQPLLLFRNGFCGSEATEEALALRAEARVAGLPDGASNRLAMLSAIALRARAQSFTGLYRGLVPLVGAAGAWMMCVRVKRGLAEPEEPGAYAKDRVYWLGWCRLHTWIAAGGDPALLMVGKVGVHHPVQSWIDAGWASLNPPG